MENSKRNHITLKSNQTYKKKVIHAHEKRAMETSYTSMQSDFSISNANLDKFFFEKKKPKTVKKKSTNLCKNIFDLAMKLFTYFHFFNLNKKKIKLRYSSPFIENFTMTEF